MKKKKKKFGFGKKREKCEACKKKLKKKSFGFGKKKFGSDQETWFRSHTTARGSELKKSSPHDFLINTLAVGWAACLRQRLCDVR